MLNFDEFELGGMHDSGTLEFGTAVSAARSMRCGRYKNQPVMLFIGDNGGFYECHTKHWKE